MKHKLFRILDPGEMTDQADITYNGQWENLHPGDIGAEVSFGDIVLRPFSAEGDTESTEDLDEVFRHGLSPVYAEAREAERLKLLRYNYAGLAMQGILASRKVSGDGVFPWEEIAPSSVQMADALIAALNKKEEAV